MAGTPHLTTADEIDLFFEDPTVFRQPPGDFGILYLLRRDIDQCVASKILWPGAMAVMAGIDLLAKFFAGCDKPADVGRRFKSFVAHYFHCPEHEKHLIYQLRNSLLHSFGLYFEDPPGAPQRFQLQAEVGKPLVEPGRHGKYRVDLLALHQRFESGVEEYRQDLLWKPALQSNFYQMFSKYGSIPVE